MINNKEILYIKQGNCETIIYTSSKEIKLLEKIDKVFNKWCLDSLTTYKGRMEAIKQKYQLKKLVPIYINKDLMLFPVNNKKDVDNIYINVLSILKIEEENNLTKIIFKNNDFVYLTKSYKLVNNYYKKCLKIYYSIK